MSYIPKNLNNDFLSDDEIRNYYSLTLTDDFYEQRIDKIIAEYMDGNKQFKTKIGEGKSASNAKRSFKKRLKGFIKNPPKKSSVYNSFLSWRVSRIHYHISKQNKATLEREPSANQEKRIIDLEYKVKKLTEENQKLIQENNQLKSGSITIHEIEDEESSDEDLVEVVSPRAVPVVPVKEEVEVKNVLEEIINAVIEEVKEEEVKEEEVKEEEVITGQYETCENLEEGIELYKKTCKKKMLEVKVKYNKDNFRELVSLFSQWQEEEREILDECHDIKMDGPDSWDNLFEKQQEKFKDELIYHSD
tara:strand:+ start:33 stop:944 length:912 start_codon:yes stop_codon:yes gene_type:complete